MYNICMCVSATHIYMEGERDRETQRQRDRESKRELHLFYITTLAGRIKDYCPPPPKKTHTDRASLHFGIILINVHSLPPPVLIIS